MYNNDFYESLIKPSFVPPSKIFRFVWPILYLLMAISLFLIIKTQSDLKSWAIGIFCVQLLLNICWSPVFFILKQIKTALLISFLLTICMLLMVIIFYDILPISGIIQIPYLLWLYFATYLNLEFIRLNPEVEE